VISLKKYIDSNNPELLNSTRDSFRDSLTAMGSSAVQVCPHISENLQQSLLNLRDRLVAEPDPVVVTETGKQVGVELEKWGKSASEYFRQTANEVKEIMMVVAQTTAAVGDRDQRYARQITDFASRLEALGNLNDLARIRSSLSQSAVQLKSCVERMVQDGEQSISKLRAELSVYENKLKEVEQMATQDPVTGLANRRKIERQIELRVAEGRNFSVAVFDLNGFKQINDVHGHLAGDQLLKQFADELRTFFRSTDMVSRWGGDEFLAVLDGDANGVKRRIESIRDWVYGEYTVKVQGELKQVKVSASVGMAAWQPGETAAQLLERADAAMYEQKAQSKAQTGQMLSRTAQSQ
jgi:diguanylate cyclase (GGDEF)-like protein